MAQERINWIFSSFKNVCVSVSGGKDSTVLFELTWRIAQELGREVNVFFLDQEAEYEATIGIVRGIMNRPGVVAHWYQCPYKMTNATSYNEPYLYAWEPGKQWIRDKEPGTIHENSSGVDRFYPFMEWFEDQWGADTAMLIGLRSEESLNRYGAVTRNPGYEGVKWSSKSKGKSIKFYPLYDWAFEDIWTYLGTEKVPYNKVYDWMWVKGFNIPEMRVSNLIHERAFKSLAQLQEFEPETYERLLKRLDGVHTAALYAKEQEVYSAKKLPPNFKKWKDYRDFLLQTLPVDTQPFVDRFATQKQTESIYKQQVRQLLLNDWENNIPVIQQTNREDPKKKWMELL
jgi:predicted phosphoadenosine phosphosulfate sulfurtransferase